MQDVEIELNRRFSEIEEHLGLVRKLEALSRRKNPPLQVTSQSLQVLKANTFLLLYNLVESCVRSTLVVIYTDIVSSATDYSAASEKVRDLWVVQQMKVPSETANLQTFLSQARTLAAQVSTKVPLLLDSRKLPISGNLDADGIRRLCDKHGFELKVPKFARGGIELGTVREQRRALAHGDKSFSECGRDYTVDDLHRISKQTKHFLKGFVTCARRYHRKRAFLV